MTSSPPSRYPRPHQTWKNPLEQAVDQEMCAILALDALPGGLTQTAVVGRIVDTYKEEQEFIVARTLPRNSSATWPAASRQ